MILKALVKCLPFVANPVIDHRDRVGIELMQREPVNILVIGMGSWAFGKERRAVSVIKHMPLVWPYFLTQKWEDGSVSRLLQEHNFEFAYTSFGYLGRAKPLWTLINCLQMPVLWATMISAYIKKRCRVILILSIHAFVNASIPILVLKCLGRARLVFYLGDIPTNDSFHRAIARLVNKVTDRVIANSQAVKRGLAAIGIDEGKIQVIYNGVDVKRFVQASPTDLRKRYGWTPNAILVGYVGQFALNKGIWDFVNMGELVLQQDQNCRFVMVGQIYEGNSYQREVAKYVETRGLGNYFVFTGRVDEVEKTYAALDIVVVPSRYEDPAANVNIEAMAAAVPVIATWAGGAPEMVVNGETGFLVEKGKPEEIAERVLRLVRDVELRKKMGRAGRERVHQMFNIHKNAALVEKVLVNG